MVIAFTLILASNSFTSAKYDIQEWMIRKYVEEIRIIYLNPLDELCDGRKRAVGKKLSLYQFTLSIQIQKHSLYSLMEVS